MPPRRKLNPVPNASRPEPPDLRDALETAVADMAGWVNPSDEALIALARRYASEIEQVQDRAREMAELSAAAEGRLDVYTRLAKLEAHCNVTKVVGWLGPQLQGVLRDLGGTPAARKAMRPDAPMGGRLAELRASATKTPGA